ncbi:MAG: flagellar basal-body rod protein FlgF, partial [Bdellovibrionaceae bacterium]|nr:flagellar basal-body rod protein FlgF [Pseudobdellovibrionaceae bacterium]
GSGKVYISDSGEVFDVPTNLVKISVLNVSNPDSLQKVGNNNYSFKSNMPADVTQVKTPSLKQGFLETSNVNIVNEMTDMIMAQRVFEGTQKAIHVYDQMADKLINVVGSSKG